MHIMKRTLTKTGSLSLLNRISKKVDKAGERGQGRGLKEKEETHNSHWDCGVLCPVRGSRHISVSRGHCTGTFRFPVQSLMHSPGWRVPKTGSYFFFPIVF
jgi:hypothetical protein